jgi:hypothetical protein
MSVEPGERPRAGLQYERLYLPPGTSRRTATTVLTLHAEYGEWELDRLRLYPDGSRRVILRRRARPGLPAFLPS